MSNINKFSKKIKKANEIGNSNIIDFNLEKLNTKYNTSELPYGDKSWQFKNPDHKNVIYIDRIVKEKYFYDYLPILKDMRFYCENQLKSFSHATILNQFGCIRLFFSFLNEREIKINNLKDIDYNILVMYAEWLKGEKSSNLKWNTIILILKNLSTYDEVEVSDDINNRNFPNYSFPKYSEIKKEGVFYTKDEFDNVSKIIINIIKDYFNQNKNNTYSDIFVKTSYWLFALCTGLNETALKTLRFRDIEILKEDENTKTYLITGIKNRSKNGIQQHTITIKKNKDNLIELVLNELKNINLDLNNNEVLNNDFIFNYPKFNNDRWNNKSIRSEGFIKYKGNSIDLLKTTQFKNKITLFNLESIKLSTRMIRKHWAIGLLEATNSEQIVSRMLGHENINTTKEHYLKQSISKNAELKFNLFQELIYLFSKESNINDWVVFQERVGLKNLEIEDIINRIKNGGFDSSIGKCIKNENIVCTSYLNCFNCNNYSILGDKDLWKVMSFREALIELKQNEYNYDELYKPIIETIDSILITFDKQDILKARQLLRKNKHPFWKSPIMIKTITDNFERNKDE